MLLILQYIIIFISLYMLSGLYLKNIILSTVNIIVEKPLFFPKISTVFRYWLYS